MLLAAVLTSATVLSAQTAQSRVTGRITDESGAALPGVTVTISTAPPNQPRGAVVVSTGEGQYLSPWLPPGEYTITFALSGFETRPVAKVLLRAGETVVLHQMLPLASVAETVEVRAALPRPPEVAVPVPPPARPRPIPVEPEILASVCGPRQATDFSVALGHIVGRGDDVQRALIGPGDILRIDAGETHGVATGQNLVVRRRFQIGDRAASKKLANFSEQTAGLVQVIEVGADTSVALVVYQCGELVAGDSVEPYQAQLAVATRTGGTPRFDEAAKIIAGDNGQSLGWAQQMMVIDRGIMQGVERGQRLTIFRRARGNDSPIVTLGDGVIVAVRADSATIRIEHSTDAIAVGDLVAIHR